MRLRCVGQPGASLLLSDLHQHVEPAINRQFGLPLTELIQLDAADIPRTSTGKVKKQILVSRWLSQDTSPPAQEKLPEEPVQSKARASVLGLLQTALLKEARVFQPAEPHQPISSFGLDSLSLAQIIGNIERHTGLSCQLETCPQNPTLNELANLFHASSQEHQSTSTTTSQASIADLGRFPQRAALIHQIQAENLQMGGEVIGEQRIIRLFNASASGAPLVVIGNISGPDIQLISKTITTHPIYYLRMSRTYKSAGNIHYLAASCVDWLEACLPKTSPILVGSCMAGILVRHIALQLWNRPHRARLTILTDWNPGCEDQMAPYPGPVLYHVHEWHWGRDQSSKQTFETAVHPQTPQAMFYYATSRSRDAAQYMEFDVTVEILGKILSDPKLKPLMDQQ